MSKTLQYSEGIVTKQNIFENLNAVNPETNELKNPPKAPAKKLKPKRKKKTTKANKENSADNSDVKEDPNDVTEECSGEETVEAEEKQKEDEVGGGEERMEECDVPNPAAAAGETLPTPQEPTTPIPPTEPSDTTPAALSNDPPSDTHHPDGDSAPPPTSTELDSTPSPSENQSEPSMTQAPPPPQPNNTPPLPPIRYGYPTLQFVNSSFRRGGRGGRGGGGGERREEERPGRNDNSSRPYDSTSRPANPRAGPYPTRPYPADRDNRTYPTSSKPVDRDNRTHPANPSKPNDRDNRTYPTSSKPVERDNRTYPASSKLADRDNRTYPTNPSVPGNPSKPADRDNRTYPVSSRPAHRDRPRPARGGNPAPGQPARDTPATNNNQPNKPIQQPHEKPIADGENKSSGENQNPADKSNANTAESKSAGGNVDQPSKGREKKKRTRKDRAAAKEAREAAAAAAGGGGESKDGQSVPPRGDKETALPTQASRGGKDRAQSGGKPLKDVGPVPAEVNNGKQTTPPPATASNGQHTPAGGNGQGQQANQEPAAAPGQARNNGGKSNGTTATVVKPSGEMGNKTVAPDRSNKSSSVEKEGPPSHPMSEQSRGQVEEHSRHRGGERQRYGREERDRDGRPRGEERDRDGRARGEERDRDGRPRAEDRTRGYSGQNRGYNDRYPDERRGGYRRSFAPESNRDVDNRDGNYRDGNKRDSNYRDGNKRDSNYRDGSNRDGNYKDGNNRDGNNREGNNRDGYNREGNNRDGNNRDGNSMGPPPPPRRGRNSGYRSSTRPQQRDQGGSGSQTERPRSQGDHRASGQQNGYVSSSDDQHLVNGDMPNNTSSSNQRSSSRNKRRPSQRNRISGERRVHTKPEPSPAEVTSHPVDGTESTVSPPRETTAQFDSRPQSENIVMNGARVEGGGEPEVDNTRDKDGKTKKWSDESWADDAPRKPSPYEEQTNRVKVTHEPVSIPNTVPYNQTVREVQGDLMAAPVEYSLAIGVSEDFRMPSGLPALFRNEFRQLDILLDKQARMGDVACLDVKPNAPRHVLYLVTKKLAHQKPVLKTLRYCMENLRKECSKRGVRCIAMPQLGSGPDRLDWRDVKPLIEQAFDGSDIQVLVYMQNEDHELYSKAKLTGAKLTIEPKPVVDIEPWTSIIVLTSADGTYNTQQIHALHDKFNVLDDLERQLPEVSVGSVISMRRSDYYLNFFIVSPSPSTPFKFESISKCLQTYKKHLHKDLIEYVAFEVLPDRNAPNELLNEKLVSFMKNSLPFNISLHVCWPEHIEDRYFISRTKTATSLGNVQQSALTPRIESYQGNAPRYHSNQNNASQGFHSNSHASSNNNRLIQIDSNRHFPKL